MKWCSATRTNSYEEDRRRGEIGRLNAERRREKDLVKRKILSIALCRVRQKGRRTTLCTWQHKRGALYILILTRFRRRTFRGTVSGRLNHYTQSEGSAWFGRDLRQMGTGARLGPNLSAMNCVRVWTNSFTMAEQIQQEAIAREGPLHSEELFPLAENCDTR